MCVECMIEFEAEELASLLPNACLIAM